MTRDDMKNKLRTILKAMPADDSAIDLAIDESIQFVWNFHDWSFKNSTETFTTTASTAEYELDTDIDTIIGMVYGTNNRVINPLPLHMINEMYNNISRTDSDLYWYVFKTADADKMTIEIVPTPSSAETITIWYLKRIDYGDLTPIPEKLHGLLFKAAREFFSGDIEGSQSIISALSQAVNRDKPTIRKRTSVGLDGLMKSRVNSRGGISGGNSTSDTRYPYN